MDILILRPLLTAIVEYFLAFKSWKNAVRYKVVSVFLLIFLATYQLGEFVFFLNTDKNLWALKVAFASTTLLPPLGVMLIEKITNKNYFSKIVLVIFSLLSLAFLIVPDSITQAEKCNCFTKVINYSNDYSGVSRIWMYFYPLAMFLSMLILAFNYFKVKETLKKREIKLAFLTYASFFPTSLIVIFIFGVENGKLPSIMCALAIIGAFLIYHVITRKEENS